MLNKSLRGRFFNCISSASGAHCYLPVIAVQNTLLGVITIIQHINNIHLHSYQLFRAFPGVILLNAAINSVH